MHTGATTRAETSYKGRLYWPLLIYLIVSSSFFVFVFSPLTSQSQIVMSYLTFSLIMFRSSGYQLQLIQIKRQIKATLF